MDQKQLRYRDYALLFLLVGSAAILFSSSVNFSFTNWDDDIHVTNNPAIQQLSYQSVVELFKPTDRYMYHPLTMVSYMIEWRFAGEQAWLFHLTNICLHLTNIFLVYLLFFRISSNTIFSFFITAIFAFHPIQVESVAWISARKDLLAALFMLGSILSYFRWKEKRTIWLYGVSLVFFLCALFSKPSSVVLPLLLVLLSWFKDENITWNSVLDKIPFAIISAAFTIFIVATTTSNTTHPLFYYSFIQRILLIVYEIVFYAGKFIVPANLSTCYSYPVLTEGVLSVEYYVYPLILTAIIVLSIYYRKESKSILFGVLFYVFTLLPVLQIIPFHNASLVADRYAYLAILGLAFSTIQFSTMISDKIRSGKVYVLVILVSIAGLYAFLSIERLPVWNDSISLFTDVIKKDPNIPLAYGNRANAKIASGDFEGAIEDCNRLIYLNANEPKAYYNRGNAYSEMKMRREAVTDYSRSIELGFKSPNVFYNRGNNYLSLNVFDSAAIDYHRVLSHSPGYINALVQLEFMASTIDKDYERSVFYLTEYQKYNPNDAWMYYRRALSNAQLNRFGAALSDASLASALNQHSDIVDDFFVFLNMKIDSINSRINTLSDQLEKPVSNDRLKIFKERSELYSSLGDTLRAKRDRAVARQLLNGNK